MTQTCHALCCCAVLCRAVCTVLPLLHAQAIAYHVTQLRSPEPLQQLQAVTALAGLTAYTADEDPQDTPAAAAPAGDADLDADAAAAACAAAAADAGDDPDQGPYASSAAAAVAAGLDIGPSSSSEVERYKTVCRQVVDAGGFPALVSLLQQAPEEASTSAAAGGGGADGGDLRDLHRAVEVQRLGVQVLWSVLVSSSELYQLAVDAGVVPVLEQLLGSPRADIQCLAVNTLLALAASTQPAVQAAVLRPELFAPAAALLNSEDPGVQVSAIELLQLLLRGQQQTPVAFSPGAGTAAAAGASSEQKAAAAAAGAAVVALSRLLADLNSEVQKAASIALWTFISMARPAAVAQQVAALLCNSCPETQLEGFELLTGLLVHFGKEVRIEVLSSAGVIEAALRLLGSYEPTVQAAAAKAAAFLSMTTDGVAIIVSIPQAVQQLVRLLRRDSTQESAANALRWIAENLSNSIILYQLESVRESCCAQLRAAGAIPAGLNLLKSSMNSMNPRFKPSSESLRSVMRMLECCGMRPDAAGVIRQAGGVQVLQQLVVGHQEVEVRQWADGMLHQGLGAGLSL